MVVLLCPSMQSIQNLGLAVIAIAAGMILDTRGYLFLEVFFSACVCCECGTRWEGIQEALLGFFASYFLENRNASSCGGVSWDSAGMNSQPVKRFEVFLKCEEFQCLKNGVKPRQIMLLKCEFKIKILSELPRAESTGGFTKAENSSELQLP